jgi:PAS domain S-box-containing protein
MKEKPRTIPELIEEISVLNRKIKQLEQSDSDRKRIEEALQESEIKFRTIFESLEDIYYQTDLNGIITLISPSVHRISGWKPEELIGQPTTVVYAEPEDRAALLEAMAEQGYVRDYELTLIMRDGSKAIASLAANLIYDSSGAPAGLAGSLRNITDRKQAEEALRESEERYKNLFDNHAAVKLLIDPETGRIIDANEAAVHYYGWSRDRLRQMKIQEINTLSPEDIQKEMEKVRTNKQVYFEFRHRRADGSIRDVEVFSSKIKVKRTELLHSIIHDITKRKRAEKGLRESEERYRRIFETTLEGIYQATPQGRYLRVNPAFALMLGYASPEDLIGSITDIGAQVYVNPERRSEFKRHLSEHDRIENFEAHLYRKDGTTMWGLINAVTVRNKDREILHYQGGMIDITDRKRAEEALRNSEAKYQFLVESMADVVFTLDINLATTYVSPSIERMLGFTQEERMAQKADQQLTPQSHKLAFERLAAELDREKGADLNRSQTLELEYYHKDGSIKHLVTYIRGIRDSEGNLTGFYGSHHDITDRKRVEELLRISEQKYRHLFEKAEEGILIVRGETIEFANPALARILRWPLDRIIDHPFVSFIHPEDREMVFDRHRRRMRGETVETGYDFRIVASDGNVRWLRITSRVIEWDDKPASLSFLTDITDHKLAEEEKRRLEEHLKHAQKMESIGTLAGGIAHDFNNLLMGIQGYASLTLLDLDPSHPHYERLKRIEEQVQSGADLTRQLLGFARGGRYEVMPADMNDIINKTSSMFGRTKKEISMHRKYGKDLRTVEVDHGQMEQVFLNLYVNAWQAMPGGGEIYLETENVLLDDEQAFPYAVKPGRYVKITVTDTGTGMDEKTKERIFDPFFTTKEMGRGTGLGLATVYGIIKGHKGMIDVDSEPGHGTTFTIYLPASEKEVVKDKAATGTIARGAETILLVDDEKMVVEVTRELLESLGYRVYAAGSGQEALALYMEKRDEIDLVILDMIMPGISGGETFDRLKELNPDIRVLLSSGYSINGEAKDILDRGCNGFLQKPFHLEKLSRKVREILG